MSGPIVRTGTTPKFWQNWDSIFGGKKQGTSAVKTAKPPKAAKKASTPSMAKKAKKSGSKKK